MSFNKSGLKAAVFIDHSNIASPILGPNCVRNERFDCKKFKDFLLQGYSDAGAFMFMGVMDPIKPEKEKFMTYFEKIGFIIMRVPLIKRRDGKFEQKQLDILMHEHMVTKAEVNEFNIAILVSGDADFVLAVKLIKGMNKDVIVCSWRESMSQQLLEAVGKENVIYIDDIWEKIRRKKS